MTKSASYQKVWNLLTQECVILAEQHQYLAGSPASFWRLAVLEGKEGQQALSDWAVVVQSLATTREEELEPLLDKVLALELSPAWLAEEAIRTNHFLLLKSLIARQAISSVLNQVPRDEKKLKTHPTDNQSLGEILVLNASPDFIKKAIRSQLFDPTTPMTGEFQIFDTSSTSQFWTPLAWCIFHQKWSIVEELLKNPSVQKDQQSLDEALFLLGFPQQFYSLEKSNKGERALQIKRVLELGADPNRSFEISRKGKDIKGKESVIHEKWTSGLRWVYLLINRLPKSIIDFDGLEQFIHPYLEKLEPEHWEFRPNVIHSTAMRNFQQMKRNHLSEKLVELSIRIKDGEMEDTLIPLVLSFKENEQWPLKWASEHGYVLTASRLKELIKANMLAILKKRGAGGMVNEAYTFHDLSLSELKEVLPEKEQEPWQHFIDEFKRYNLTDKYSSADFARLELFLKLEESKSPHLSKRL